VPVVSLQGEAIWFDVILEPTLGGSNVAIVWNKCTAKSQGEQRLARLLESLESTKLRLCFSVDFVPGCREIDLLLLHEELGAYIIEVKAVSLQGIESISPNRWKIKGRSTDESPLHQAYSQFEGLRAFWNARMPSKLPQVCTTVCLSEISRHEWEQAFANDEYAISIASGMMFQEDMTDIGRLEAKLDFVMRNPPMRTGRNPWRLTEVFLSSMERLLAPTTRQSATQGDRQRLKAIENGVDRTLAGEFPAGGNVCVVFTGQPGTGKTFRLLSVGVSHCYASQRVLFVCFNKTLASDIRRLLSFDDRISNARFPIDIVDVNQLAKRCFDMNGLPFEATTSADEWGRMVVRHLREMRSDTLMESYNTILVDEAHDMMDWQLDLIRLHAEPGATCCIAIGRGQELYRDDSSSVAWLKTFSSDNKVREVKLRRNFRNTKGQYFAALAFHRAWPDRFLEVDKVYAEVFRHKKGTLEIDFERNGEPLTYYPVPALPGEFDDHSANQMELVSEEFATIIRREIVAIDDDEFSHPVGLLVLVPSETCIQTAWVRTALKKATADRDDISFIDYTDEETRRSSALNSEIRLCTFHSSRGLEGERVLIFGLEQLTLFSQKTNVKPENLGFIALSRGVFRTQVVVRSHFPSESHALIKKILTLHDQGVN
jgi:hypothetical protein